MSRWVERKGKRVEFGNVVAGFCGKPYIYEFPDVKMAKRFASFVGKKDKVGSPVGVPDGHWAKPFFKGHGG
jgi:hypothetical protein